MPDLLAGLYDGGVPLILGFLAISLYLKKKRTISPPNWLLYAGVLLMLLGGIRTIDTFARYAARPQSQTKEEFTREINDAFDQQDGLLNEDLAFRSQAGVQLNIPAGFEVLSPNDGRIDLIARAQDGVVILLVPQESTLTARELALEIFHAAKNPTRRLVSESDETRNGREAFRLRSEMEENGDLFECSTIIMKGTTRHNILIISALATNPPEVKTIFEDIANSFLASQP